MQRVLSKLLHQIAGLQLLTWSGHTIVFVFHKLTNFCTFTFRFSYSWVLPVPGFQSKDLWSKPTIMRWCLYDPPPPITFPRLPGCYSVTFLALLAISGCNPKHYKWYPISHNTVCIWWAYVHSCRLLSEYLVSMVSYKYPHSTRLLPLTLLQVCSTSNNTDGNKRMIFFLL